MFDQLESAVADAATESDTGVAVAVVCDHRPVVRAGLQALLTSQESATVAASVEDVDLVSAVRLHQPSIVFVGLSHEANDPFTAVAMAKALHENMIVIGLVDERNIADIREGVVAGVDSLLPYTASQEDIQAAINAATRGEQWVAGDIAMQLAGSWTARTETSSVQLTRRELDVLSHLSNGLTNQQIGEQLGLSARTVKTHVQHLLNKLEAPDRTGAVGKGFRLGLLR